MYENQFAPSCMSIRCVAGSAENAVDRLSFELLVPKLILQRYVSLLVEHRRVILSGSTGTGKTFLAQRLAEFIVETYVRLFIRCSFDR